MFIIYNSFSSVPRVTAEIIYRIAQGRNVSMEERLAPCFLRRGSFKNFKCAVCHRLRELGDIDFIEDSLKRQEIRAYYDRKMYPESLYLLAMLDYISRKNDIPLCEEYDNLRMCRLKNQFILPAYWRCPRL